MPHTRARHAVSLLLKKLKFSPVVAIQGARQTGKSLLVREILPKELDQSVYQTFDKTASKRFAEKNPDTYLDQYSEAHPLIIDEAQKVPEIFDAVKLEVDENRKPGRFILLGSTEFSKLSQVRESLTGRLSRIRLYALNLAEAFELPPHTSGNLSLIHSSTPRITRQKFLTYLKKGGMPGIFGIRDDEERSQAIEDWISLTIERDVHSFPRIAVDSDLCLQILQQIARLEEPTSTHIAKTLRRSPKIILKHLKVLLGLFVIHKLDPHPMSTGKPLYFLSDVSFAQSLGASFERSLYTWLVQEQLSQRSYRSDRHDQLYFYRTTKGSYIHLIVESKSKETAAIKLFSDEKLDLRELEVLKAFQNRFLGDKKIQLMGLGPSRFSFKSEPNQKIEIFPWEALA